MPYFILCSNKKRRKTKIAGAKFDLLSWTRALRRDYCCLRGWFNIDAIRQLANIKPVEAVELASYICRIRDLNFICTFISLLHRGWLRSF